MLQKVGRMLWHLFTRDGGWAPALVLVMHRAVYWLDIRKECDWLMHYSGGVAITFFFWRLLLSHGHRLGALNVRGQRVVAFALGCTMAVFWELAEFASDKFLHTQIQHHIHETMMDLVNGVCGALTTVALICLVQFSKRGT
jgi:hypothetical protein